MLCDYSNWLYVLLVVGYSVFCSLSYWCDIDAIGCFTWAWLLFCVLFVNFLLPCSLLFVWGVWLLVRSLPLLVGFVWFDTFGLGLYSRLMFCVLVVSLLMVLFDYICYKCCV